jgi:hypothetical protein
VLDSNWIHAYAQRVRSAAHALPPGEVEPEPLEPAPAPHERPDGRRAHVLGAAPRGGLRIDGGAAGFAERTVSPQDIAWVIAADDDVHERGGVLDEERINRLRYLEGTPSFCPTNAGST